MGARTGGPGFCSPVPKGGERCGAKSPWQPRAPLPAQPATRARCTPSKLSRNVARTPSPCPGKVLLGTWPGAHRGQDTFGPAARIYMEGFPKLFVALVQLRGPSGSGFICALGDHLQLLWPKNTLLCLRLGCIYITCIYENREKAVDVSVLNRPSSRSFVARNAGPRALNQLAE